MKIVNWNVLTAQEQTELLERPAISQAHSYQEIVKQIIYDVQTKGDQALISLTQKFDCPETKVLKVSQSEIEKAETKLSQSFKNAVEVAYRNIATFHQAQIKQDLIVETMPGVICELISRPIESVGLYIPSGTAPLPSTALMLGIPAKLAGCNHITLCSPPPIADEILYIAKLCGITEIYNIGGAQAVAAMAFGTESITKVDKIFGPGNAYVTEAKRQVAQMQNGAAIDMPAGPSEVLIIADEFANPDFIAADLLSQAEHGADSQVVLVTTSNRIAREVEKALERQIKRLSRAETARESIKLSMMIIAENLSQCISISNKYGPEHLIIQTENARKLLSKITNAGSIFLGSWSPESVGDYASGTNHVLPTYGHTRTYSSLSLADFTKKMTVQELTAKSLLEIAPSVIELANAEHLDAHKNAVTIRLAKLADGEK